MNPPPRKPQWAPPPGYGGPTPPQNGYPQHQQGYSQPLAGHAYPQPYSPPQPLAASPNDEDDVDDDGISPNDDAPIADSPSWGAIGVLVAVILVGAGAGAGLGFVLDPSETFWLGAVLGGFAAGTFGVAGIGWSYRNMDWIPMSYGERTLVLVMGILFHFSPLFLHLLHPGH